MLNFLSKHPAKILYAAGSVLFAYGAYLLNGDAAWSMIWLGLFDLLAALVVAVETSSK